jgi:hypothetical protein
VHRGQYERGNGTTRIDQEEDGEPDEPESARLLYLAECFLLLLELFLGLRDLVLEELVCGHDRLIPLRIRSFGESGGCTLVQLSAKDQNIWNLMVLQNSNKII